MCECVCQVSGHRFLWLVFTQETDLVVLLELPLCFLFWSISSVLLRGSGVKMCNVKNGQSGHGLGCVHVRVLPAAPSTVDPKTD